MSPSLSSGFVLPRPGSSDVRSVLMKLRLLALRRLLAISADSLASPFAGALRRLQRVLPVWLREHPDILDAIEAPEVLTPLLALESGALSAAEAIESSVPHLLLGISARARVRDALLWDVPLRGLVSAELGIIYELEPPALGLSIDANGPEIRIHDGTLQKLESLRQRR
jgi:hypothetical protein